MTYKKNLKNISTILLLFTSHVATSSQHDLTLSQVNRIVVLPEQLPLEFQNEPEYLQQRRADYYSSDEQRRYIRGIVPLQNATAKVTSLLETNNPARTYDTITLFDYSQLREKPTCTVDGDNLWIHADVTTPELQQRLLYNIQNIQEKRVQEEQIRQGFQTEYERTKRTGLTN